MNITADLIVTISAVLVAIGSALWAFYVGLRLSASTRRWAARKRLMEQELEGMTAVVATDPDVLMIWDKGAGPVVDNAGAGSGTARWPLRAPDRILGAGKLGANPERNPERPAAARFEDFVSGLTDDSRHSLAEMLSALRHSGAGFSLFLRRTDGEHFEADGRTAGGQAVVRVRSVSPERREIERLVGLLREADSERQSLGEVLDALSVPAWQRDKNLQLSWANRAYAEAVDAETPDAAVARGLELESSARALAETALQENGETAERRYVVYGGRRRAMQLVHKPVSGGVLGFAIDVTALDDLEQEFRRHLEAHRDTLNKLPTAVAIFGADKRLKFFNRAYAKLWDLDAGWLAEEPEDGEILQRLREAGALPEQPNFQAWKQQRLALYNEVMEEQEETWHLPDERTLRVTCRPYPLGGLIYLYEDVSGIVALESSYNTLADVQRVTLDNLHEGVCVFGADGRLKLFNSSFVRMWNLDTDTLEGEPHFDVLTEHCRPQLASPAEWRRIARRVTAAVPERRFEPGQLDRADGSVVNFTVEPLPDGRLLLTFMDVTDTASIERALRERNEALETADRLKSEFISNVSYQLRTPLNSIQGFGQILESGMAGRLTKRQKTYIRDILSASQDLKDLIGNILDLAMVEAGTLSLDLGDVEVCDLLNEARDYGVTSATDTQLQISVDCAENVGAIRADGRRLKQVLFNLMSNAVRFTPPGGSVTLGAERSGPGVRLWVEDTGSGIEAENQARVFERFSAPGTGVQGTSRRGAGVGLALVKSFVELHGGWVTLESEPGKGTRVVCHLPADPQVTATQAAE
ncbi:MAG: PAS-domain containing protein [Alphaproteobacteria bacterium]